MWTARSISPRSRRCSPRTAKNRRLAMRLLCLSVLMLCLSITVSQASEGGIVRLEFLAPAESSPQTTPATGPSGEPAIQVTGSDAATTTTIIACRNPPLSHHQYVVRGEVKYEGVAGDGYLELLNNFGPQGEYFTRSLSSWGPTK